MLKQKQTSILAGTTLFAAFAFALFLLTLFPSVRAVTFEDPSTTLGLGTADLKDTVIRFINWALGLLGIVAVAFLIYGGYVWLTSGGNKDRIQRAKKIIINTLIGLAIIIFSWAIVNYIIRTTDEVLGPGGDVCTEGEISGCYVCASGDWVFEPSLCTLPVEQFEIRSITTTCSSPPAYHDDVYRCSAVSIIFNHQVDRTPLRDLIETDESLRVAQCDDGQACTATSQPTPLFAADPPHIVYSDSTPVGDRAEFVANGSSISFLHSHEFFAENTYYKLSIPKTIRDTSGRLVSGCRRPDGSIIPDASTDGLCTETATDFEWIFRVGEDTDVTAPTITSTYPVSGGDDYPDRNVSRNPVLWARYSEAIAPWTVSDTSVTLSPISGSVNPDGSGGTVGAPLGVDSYDVFINESGNGIEVVLTDGVSLDAFTWYELVVQNITDMCSLVQEPPIQSWRFETNGLAAGVRTVYPTDDFVCVDTDIFVLLNTSMYDPETHSCGVPPMGAGYVDSGSISPSIPRLFDVEDDLPMGPDIDPNDYCKKYSFRPTSGELEFDRPYSANVATHYPIDREGGTLNASWNFRTAPSAEECAYRPYIESLSPSEGPIGQCLSVIGNYFDRAPPTGQGPGDRATFSGNPSSPLSWADRSVVTTAPSFGAPPFVSPVQVTVDYGGEVGQLTSNSVDYNYLDTSESAGPCLERLQPDTGSRGQGFQLFGERFDPDSTLKRIHFGGISFDSDWSSDTAANASVPLAATEEVAHLVSLENDAGESNALSFFVSSVPPGSFTVLDGAPTCGTACPDASVRARFSTDALDAATITTDTVELYRCPTEACDSGLTEDTTTVLSYTEDTREVYFPPSSGLVTGQDYRAVVHGGSSGVRTDDSRQLSNLNYDSNGDSVLDAYSWIFGASGSPSGCSMSRIVVEPDVASVAIGGGKTFTGYAYTDPNECNPSGEELDPYDFTWNWSSSDISRATVAPESPDPITTATGHQPTVSPVEIRASVDAEQDHGLLSVLPIECTTEADCDVTVGDGFCDGSQCVAGICTPVVDNISPASGTVGTWVTVNGCNFDTYRSGASSVTFLQDTGNPTDDLTGLWPDPAVCGAPGSTWSDTQIITEVPNQTTGDTSDDVTSTGSVRVTRGTDGAQAVSADTFNPGGVAHPGICRVSPTSGPSGTTRVTIDGTNFGASQTPGNDFVTFFDRQEVAASETTWEGENRIRAYVPIAATNNPAGGEIVVTNDDVASNEANFDVVPSSCEVCSVDTDCDGGSGIFEGCGFDGPFRCCSARPEPDTLSPVTPPTVCRNAAISGQFHEVRTVLPMSMQTSSINPSTLTVTRVSDGFRLPIDSSDFHFPESHRFIVTPGLLDADTEYEVTVKGDATFDGIPEGVVNTKRVGVNGDTTWRFTTSDSLCDIGMVRLNPASLFFTTIGGTRAIQATAYTAEGVPLSPVPGLYDWEWQWSSDDTGVASVTSVDIDSDDRVDDTQTVVAAGNGSTTTRVEARSLAGWTGSKFAAATTAVEACVASWPASPPYTDATIPSANFSLWFCRDSGLPALNAVTPRSSTPSDPETDELLKEFFFENPNLNPETNKKDAFGLLVWENEQHLSPAAWYERKFNENVSEAQSETDGYASMRIGTTTYVAGTNLSSGTLYTNMYVLGYNADASEETLDIVRQLVDSFALNVNAGDFVYESVDAPTALEQVRRDTQRLTAIGDYIRALEAYDSARGTFPVLEAGTYLSGMSTSAWPSWDETLGAALQSDAPDEAVIHTDPLNTFSPSCSEVSPLYDPTTCWDETNKKFFCPVDSHIYAYQVEDGGETFDLFAHLKYLGNGSWQTGASNPCTEPSACPCFNYTVNGSGSISGDTTPPTIPTGVAATATGPTTIDVAWNPSTDGESGVAAYRIFRSADDVTFFYQDAVSFEDTTWTDSGLTTGITYFYRVSAVDYLLNESAQSASTSATTLPPADTTPPGNVTDVAVAEAPTEYTVTWTEPGDADFEGVAIYRKAGIGSFVRTDLAAVFLANVPGGTLSYRDSTFAPSTAYTYGVFAYDEAPNYASGAYATVTPLGSVYGDNIENLVIAAGDTVVDFTWTNPANPDYDGVMIRRAVGAPPSLTTGVLVAHLPKIITSYTDTGLTNDTLYGYAFFAHNATPDYASGVFTTATPFHTAYTDNIEDLAIAPGDTVVDFTWTNPANPAYDGVAIRRAEGAPPSLTTGVLVANLPATATSYHDTGLTNGTLYGYSFFAHDDRPEYASGAFISGMPVEPPYGDILLGFTATAGDAEVLLTWLNPVSAEYRGAVIRRSTTGYPTSETDGDFVADIAVSVVPNDRYLDTGVLNDVTYYYAAFAYNDSGAFGSGVFASARPDQTPPTILSVLLPPKDIVETDAVLKWTTNEPTTSIVQLGTTPGMEFGGFGDGSFDTNHTLRFSDWRTEGLVPNTRYYFQIIAIDIEGNVTYDSVRTFVTDYEDGASVRWEGYAEPRQVGTWNGTANPAVCGASCNQFYVCTVDGLPDCSDPRNGAAQNPGASTICGALAYADCVDGTANLAQGPAGTLTQALLDSWTGSKLPQTPQYQTACSSPTEPLDMPYANGTWTNQQGGAASAAKTIGRDGTCVTEADRSVGATDQPLSIVTP